MHGKKLSRILISVFLVLFAVASFPAAAFADGGSGADPVWINVHFVTSGGIQNDVEFPYSDGYFSLDSHSYSPDLAMASAGLTVAAYRDGYETFAKEYFDTLGFEDPDISAYETLPGPDTIAYCIGHKHLDGFTLLAVGVCGGGYGKEWASNFKIGDEERAVGFNEAAQKVNAAIRSYMERYPMDGPVKLWVTGQSRAGAVSNIVAADMTDSGMFTDVYGYSFGTPRVTRNPGSYDNIFCIMGKDDIVPKVPLADWGYKHFGTELYLRSVCFDSDFFPYAYSAYNMSGNMDLRCNPSLYDQYRVLFNYIYELMPTPADYVEHLQDSVIAIISASDSDNIVDILSEAVKKFEPHDEYGRAELEGLKSYLDKMGGEYLLHGYETQIKTGGWLLDETLGQNLMFSHTVTTYTSWILSKDSPELFTGNSEFLHITFTTDADISVYDRFGLVETAYADGTFTFRNGQELPDVLIACVRSGSNVNIDLPLDKSYTIAFSPDRNESTDVTAVRYSTDTVVANLVANVPLKTAAGEKSLIFSPGAGRGITVESGGCMIVGNTDLSRVIPMSAVNQMQSANVFNLSLSDVIKLCFIVAAVVLAELLLQIIFFIVRKVRKTERSEKARAAAFIGNITFLLLAELLVWYLVPTLPVLRVVLEIATYIGIISYARRGRNYVPTYFLAAVLAVFCLISARYTGEISLLGILLVCARDLVFATAAYLIGKK